MADLPAIIAKSTGQDIEIVSNVAYFATPLGFSLHALCRKYAIDLHQPEIPEGINLGYFEFIGFATVVDSLSAIKKLVFEEHRLTLKEIKEAVAHNFEGYETIRQLLLHAPSYGNNDPQADEIGRLLDREAQKFTAKYGSELKVHMDLRLVPFTSHVPFGKVVGATPNGRKAWTLLSDGSSASQGADACGYCQEVCTESAIDAGRSCFQDLHLLLGKEK